MGKWPLLALFFTGVAHAAAPDLLGIDTTGKRILINVSCSGSDCDFVRKLYEDMRTDFRSELDRSVYVNRVICNREDILFKTGGEKDTNHLGKSCGKGTCEFRVDTKKPDAEPKLESASCEKERAWKDGALVEKARIKLEEVIAEIRERSQLVVRSACASAFEGENGKNLALAINAMNAEWKNVMKGQPITCDLVSGGGSGSMNQFYLNDRRVPVQAGCHLSSALGAIYAAIAQAGVCEAFARAEEDWDGAFERQVDGIVERLSAEAIAFCKRKRPEPKGGALAGCANQEYSRRIEDEFNKPAGGELRPAPSPTPGQAPGPISLSAKEKEKDKGIFSEAKERFQARAWKSLEVARSGLNRAAEFVSNSTVYQYLQETSSQPTGPGSRTLTFPQSRPKPSPTPGAGRAMP